MRFWMSWYETQTDWRAVTDPPPDGIVGYWCSGIDNYSDDLIICGLVEADSESSAWEIVRGDDAFPGVRERFCKPGDDWKPTDRFALSDWMKARYERTEPKGQVMAKNETPATGQGDDMLVVHDPAEALKALATPEGVAALSLAAKDTTIRELREKYHELLYAVGNAYPGETRHQTALRYIVEREARAGQAGEAKQDTAEIRRVRGEVEDG